MPSFISESPPTGNRSQYTPVMACRFLFVLLAAAICFPQAASCAERPAHNIIVLTIGGLRPDHLSFLGGSRPTPSLNAFAEQSVIFEHAYGQTPSSVNSHAGILSGTYPQTNQASEFGTPLASTVPFLPELLRAHGYQTAAFVGSIELDPFNGFAPGFDRGFDHYDAGFSLHTPGDPSAAPTDRPAAEVVGRALRWISETHSPFFLWIHLGDTTAAGSLSSYNRSLGAVDSSTGRLVAFLQQKHLFDDSVMLVCADHAESLGAHGEETHGIFLYDETTHVPLLLKLPANRMAGKRVSARVRLVDVAPSLLDVAGLPIPPRMQGQSLLRLAESHSPADETVYARSDFPAQAFGWSPLESWRAGKYLYIRAPHPELYDLAADPAAQHNLALTSRATLATIAAQLDSFDRHFQSTAEQKPALLQSSDMQKLASLGYVGLQKTAPGAQTAVEGIDPKDNIVAANKTIQAWFSLNHTGTASAALAFSSVAAGNPKSFLAQWGLGAALANGHKCTQAVEPLRTAIQILPNIAWVHYQMAVCLAQLGNENAAAIHLDTALHLAPKNTEFRKRPLPPVGEPVRQPAGRVRTAPRP